MSKTIKRSVYTFAELRVAKGKSASRAEEKARAWLIDLATGDDYWHECTLDTWKQALAQVGFDDATISFTGFWSQGDGASFTAKSVDVEKLIRFMTAGIEPSEVVGFLPDSSGKEDYRPWLVYQADGVHSDKKWLRLLNFWDRIHVYVERFSSHYSHENTCTFKADPDWHGDYPRVEALLDDWREAAEVFRKDCCHAIYKDLEEEYEYQVADEQLDEMAAANGYMFSASGSFEVFADEDIIEEEEESCAGCNDET